MDVVINTVGGALGGFFDTPIVQFGVRVIAAYVVVIWIATAYWAFRDIQTRTDNPILPYVAASLIILFTPVLFIFGVVIYRLIRPHEKIGEANERSLAEEALLNEVEAVPHCPGCARRVSDQWLICPTCRTRLNRVCPNCNRLVGLDWSLCAWCGKDFERRDLMPVTAGATPAPYQVAAAVSAGAAATSSIGPSANAPAASVPNARATSASSSEPPVISTGIDGSATAPRRSPRAAGPRTARSASDPLPER
jgi:Double zinc ribbon